MTPERVYGVDFSGAKRAGNKIWIAGGAMACDTLRIDICQSAATLPGSGAHLEEALAALRAFVHQQSPCVVGVDFPFGLPVDIVEEKHWDEFAREFRSHYPDADSFQTQCTLTALRKTGQKEIRRATDKEARTPFSPYNRRIYRQTYYGIRDFIAPLVNSGIASVLPMQPALSDRAWLLEVCPASTLKQLSLSRPYKGRSYGQVRVDLLAQIAQAYMLTVPDWLAGTVRTDHEGDALDGVIAAAVTYRSLRGVIRTDGFAEPALVEGRVYV
ncbi:MAG: DUF429 domain-containing protein [Chloroflexia bacterium]|nr:DUF429 domain-containing protein [Chloroflexia bacterium]